MNAKVLVIKFSSTRQRSHKQCVGCLRVKKPISVKIYISNLTTLIKI